MKLALILLTLAGSSAVVAAEGTQTATDAIVWPVDPMYAGLDSNALWASLNGPSVYAATDAHNKPEGCKEGPGLGWGLCKPDPAPIPAPTPEPGTLALLGAGLLTSGWMNRKQVLK